jgi:hypothetical protein
MAQILAVNEHARFALHFPYPRNAKGEELWGLLAVLLTWAAPRPYVLGSVTQTLQPEAYYRPRVPSIHFSRKVGLPQANNLHCEITPPRWSP